MDTRITDLAARQLSVVSRPQLLTLGVSRHSVRHLLRSGQLERLHAGVYAVPGSPDSWRRRLLAACLALGDDGVASHRAAAHLWGMKAPFDHEIEVSGERSDRALPDGAIVHRSTDLGPDQATLHEGIPVTTPARTLLDLGAVVPQFWVDRAVDAALAAGTVSHDDLLATLDRLGRRGRRGTGRLRHSLAERTDGAESVLEAEFQRLVHRYGLPEPVYQFEIFDRRGGFVARVDAAYPDLRIAIELDGASTRMGRTALEYDTERQNRIIDCDFLPRRYTWKAVVGTPEVTAADLRRAISRRSHELGRKSAAQHP